MKDVIKLTDTTVAVVRRIRDQRVAVERSIKELEARVKALRQQEQQVIEAEVLPQVTFPVGTVVLERERGRAWKRRPMVKAKVVKVVLDRLHWESASREQALVELDRRNVSVLSDEYHAVQRSPLIAEDAVNVVVPYHYETKYLRKDGQEEKRDSHWAEQVWPYDSMLEGTVDAVNDTPITEDMI